MYVCVLYVVCSVCVLAVCGVCNVVCVLCGVVLETVIVGKRRVVWQSYAKSLTYAGHLTTDHICNLLTHHIQLFSTSTPQSPGRHRAGHDHRGGGRRISAGVERALPGARQPLQLQQVRCRYDVCLCAVLQMFKSILSNTMLLC